LPVSISVICTKISQTNSYLERNAADEAREGKVAKRLGEIREAAVRALGEGGRGSALARSFALYGHVPLTVPPLPAPPSRRRVRCREPPVVPPSRGEGVLVPADHSLVYLEGARRARRDEQVGQGEGVAPIFGSGG
jgi:hypothetical protein